MALNTEWLITLQLIKGIGKKTILEEFAKSVGIDTLEELADTLWSSKNGRLKNITMAALQEANLKARKIIAKSEKEGIGILSYYDDAFPQMLRECRDENGKLDAPIVLYYRGNLKALKAPGIAIIGTREPTRNGYNAGVFFASELAKLGFNIVSGLANGCDTSAHRGALDVGGTTTAFLATGLNWDAIYPKENLKLAQEIVANDGLLLTEYYIGERASRYTFIDRDRLQAGLSHATIAIQTNIYGGTMHAVKATLAAKKLLFTVKYNQPIDLHNEKTWGNDKLIKERKATPLTSATIYEAIRLIDYRISLYQKGLNNDKAYEDNKLQEQAKEKTNPKDSEQLNDATKAIDAPIEKKKRASNKGKTKKKDKLWSAEMVNLENSEPLKEATKNVDSQIEEKKDGNQIQQLELPF